MPVAKKVAKKKPAVKTAKKKTTSAKKKVVAKTAVKTNARMSPSKIKSKVASKKAPIKKATSKVVVKKALAKKPVSKVITKKSQAKKPVSKVTTKKSQAKKPVSKVITKKSQAKKPVSKVTTKKSQAKKPVSKVTTKKSQAKKPVGKATTKKALPKEQPKKVISKKLEEIVSKKAAIKESGGNTKTAKKSTVKATTAKTATDKNNWRLPRLAIPEHYQISLQPNLENKTFTGDVLIDININEATDKIVLNAKEIEINQALLSDGNGAENKAKISYDKEKEFAFLTFDKSVKTGNYKLDCQFKGVLNDKLKGFYFSTWVDEQENKHPMAVTQFESTDARRAFPCFDEPDFKATYDVTLIVPKNLTAISNGRVVTETVDDSTGLKTVSFKRTMKMSTYLLAFLVGEFVSSKAVTANGIELRAWTVPGKESLTKFALDVAAYTINYFEKYFGVDYPAPDKCDFIAIPDFAAGAMENKDCITFRETALLLDEKTANQNEKERVAEVVMHELAHMWFGDLVTMRWWNGLWLNEAFATFMEMKALDTYKPEWKVWDKFGASRAAAMRVDSLKNTHPIECPVKNPEEAQELFDVISYQKGCSVLYQIEQFIGEEIFQKGINHYLNKHAYGNTETHDLWDSLEMACTTSGVDIPVRKIMDNWVFTAGHPLVSVSETKTTDTINLSQKPFMFLADKKNTTVYQIPITMRTNSNDGKATDEKFLLDKESKSVKLNKDYKYVVVNAGGSGFYRVNYSPALAKTLLANSQEDLTVIERFNLVNDRWAAVRAGFLPVTDYLDMIKLFSEEDDVSVWSIVLSSLNVLRSLTEGEARQDFKLFVRNLCQKKAIKLGWQPKSGESSQTKQLRGLLIEAMGVAGEDSETYEQALSHFADWKKDRASIDNNILPALVNTLAYHGDTERYEEYKILSKQAKTPQETLRFLYALAHFRDKKLLSTTMAICLSDEVRTQDAPFLFATLANNEIATESAWKFLQKNWTKMTKAYPDTGVVRMCSAIIPALDTPELEKEVKAFFASHKVKSGDMAISQALELLRVNILLRQREAKNLAQYLKTQNNFPVIGKIVSPAKEKFEAETKNTVAINIISPIEEEIAVERDNIAVEDIIPPIEEELAAETEDIAIEDIIPPDEEEAEEELETGTKNSSFWSS